MSITEFLLERITEDEEEAENLPAWFNPPRVLAECAAKRAIVVVHEEFDGECLNCRGDEEDEWFRENWPCTTVKAIAAVYKGHPDYDQEWAL